MALATTMPSPVNLEVIVSWPQAVVAVVVVLALLVWPGVAAWLNARNTQRTVMSARKTLVETSEHVAEVREHVANTHATNLRADLDAIAGDVREIKTIVVDLVPRVSALEVAQRQQRPTRRRLLG